MSKLHKALSALRDSGRTSSEKGAPGQTGTAKNGGPPARKQAYGPSAGEAYVSDNELLPKHRIEISLEDIVSAGIYPGEEDVEVIAQQFRRIKRPIIQIAFGADLSQSENRNVVMMASALPGAGKSFCAYNLSQSIALERDLGAVLIDADVLKPGVSRSFGLDDQIGLIDYLIEPSIQIEDILFQSNLNDVIVIPAGRQHPEATELLASRRMRDLVSLLSAKFKNRAVIFDMPPLLLTSEAQVLASQAGQIVLVIEARVSSQDSVLRAVGMLDRQTPINAILNKSRSAEIGGYQGDDYGYYSYGADSARVDQNAQR